MQDDCLWRIPLFEDHLFNKANIFKIISYFEIASFILFILICEILPTVGTILFVWFQVLVNHFDSTAFYFSINCLVMSIQEN